MAPVIVDTSEWIQYFRASESLEGKEVRRLLLAGEVVMVGVVYAELLRGARNRRQLATLQEELNALPFLEADKDTWTATGRILNDLERKGIGIPLADALIAALALGADAQVFSRDEHFQRVEGLGIRTLT